MGRERGIPTPRHRRAIYHRATGNSEYALCGRKNGHVFYDEKKVDCPGCLEKMTAIKTKAS